MGKATEIKQPICDGLSEIVITALDSKRNTKHKHISVWLCQGMKAADGDYETQYHVSTVGGELDELITKLTEIRDKKDSILKIFNGGK
jgi:hypothetical protein